jgi:signal transduction histidine kinase
MSRVLAENGPWSGLGIAVVDAAGSTVWPAAGETPESFTAAQAPIDASPGWAVVVFPRTGSLDALVAQDVTRYTLLLVIAMGAVIAALVLAARSVARELALSRLQREFVASVSHELKTPLSLIRMFAESLREGWVGEPKKQDYYEVITRESERLTGLIDNVLDFSRIEAGTRRYRFEVADVRQVVLELLERYAFHLRAAGVELVSDLVAGPLPARIDREAIEQVLVNLLSNAVKYMGDRERPVRRVTVSIARRADDLVLRVSDTGIGMSDTVRAHIFERFYRADDERVRAVAGSGLGLTLVKAHVDAHAGTIAVDSAIGQGTTFAISLPLAPAGTAA